MSFKKPEPVDIIANYVAAILMHDHQTPPKEAEAQARLLALFIIMALHSADYTIVPFKEMT